MSSHRSVWIRARLALAGRLTALVATSFFLVATSQYEVSPPPGQVSSGSACRHADLRASYRVTGSCGTAGEIVLVSPANECAINVQGAPELALPAAGRFDYAANTVGFSNGGWSLSGYLSEGSATSASVSDAGAFTVTRDAGAFTVTRDAGAPSGVVPHGALVLRKCRASSDLSGGISLECTDGSANCSGSLCAEGSLPACTASLKQ